MIIFFPPRLARPFPLFFEENILLVRGCFGPLSGCDIVLCFGLFGCGFVGVGLGCGFRPGFEFRRGGPTGPQDIKSALLLLANYKLTPVVEYSLLMTPKDSSPDFFPSTTRSPLFFHFFRKQQETAGQWTVFHSATYLQSKMIRKRSGSLMRLNPSFWRNYHASVFSLRRLLYFRKRRVIAFLKSQDCRPLVCVFAVCTLQSDCDTTHRKLAGGGYFALGSLGN